MIKVRVFDDNHLQLFYHITIQFLDRGKVLMNTKCFILMCFGDTPERKEYYLIIEREDGERGIWCIDIEKRIKLLYISRF